MGIIVFVKNVVIKRGDYFWQNQQNQKQIKKNIFVKPVIRQ